jgi:hypothetical protein
VYRDIRPDNCRFGTGTLRNVLYVVDFGRTKRWALQMCDERGLGRLPTSESVPQHLRNAVAVNTLPESKNNNITQFAMNSVRFASINAHNGVGK